MPNILVIDDEPVILEYLKMIISHLGYAVQTASDGQMGFEQAKNPDVNLIICDLNMPGEISGMDMVKKMVALKPGRPLIILSGYPTPERAKESEDIGAIEFLTKPFEIPFLASLLKRLLPLDKESSSITIQ